MAFLGDWLVKHIQGSDKKYGPFLKKEGIGITQHVDADIREAQ